MNNPDILPQLLERLREQCSDQFVQIENAWLMPPLENLYETTPALYAYLHAEGPDAQQDPKTLCPRQRVTYVYGIYLVVPADAFTDLAHVVREALFGWDASERHEPMATRGGERVNIDRTGLGSAFVEYRQLWSTDTWLQNRKTL